MKVQDTSKVDHSTALEKIFQLGIISPIGYIKSTVGDNIPIWSLGVSESGKEDNGNKSPIPN